MSTGSAAESFELFELGINLSFHSAYASTGNDIVEQIAARICCPIQEAVYWNNVKPKDYVSSSIVPTNRINRYKIRMKRFDIETSSGPGHRSYRLEIVCGSKHSVLQSSTGV